MLPDHLLRPLTLTRRTETIDPVDGSVAVTWATSQIAGRIGRGHATETAAGGRQATVTTQTLYTAHRVQTTDRIADPATGQVWEVAGDPVAVWGAGVEEHHFEVPLRRADG